MTKKKAKKRAKPKAATFEIKVENLRPSDLTWLSLAHQLQLAELGRSRKALGNPPSWAKDEKTWSDAKRAVLRSWEHYDHPYAAVAHVYERMGGSVGK